jgi:hypothetical protein
MHKSLPFSLLLLIGTFGVLSCGAGSQKTSVATKAALVSPPFDADSSYQYVAEQTAFGPRVPNTKNHSDCRAYLANKMKAYGAVTILQDCYLTSWDGSKLKATNILASYNPEKKQRILLCSHWDSRPWADQDANSANWHKPIDGANDGASGVGVLMEIGRQIQLEAAKGTIPAYGIDIVFDALFP